MGRQYSIWLRSNLINDAFQLRNAPEWLVQPKMGIVGVRLLRELSGISCLNLELQPKPKKRQDPQLCSDERRRSSSLENDWRL